MTRACACAGRCSCSSTCARSSRSACRSRSRRPTRSTRPPSRATCGAATASSRARAGASGAPPRAPLAAGGCQARPRGAEARATRVRPPACRLAAELCLDFAVGGGGLFAAALRELSEQQREPLRALHLLASAGERAATREQGALSAAEAVALWLQLGAAAVRACAQSADGRRAALLAPLLGRCPWPHALPAREWAELLSAPAELAPSAAAVRALAVGARAAAGPCAASEGPAAPLGPPCGARAGAGVLGSPRDDGPGVDDLENSTLRANA